MDDSRLSYSSVPSSPEWSDSLGASFPGYTSTMPPSNSSNSSNITCDVDAAVFARYYPVERVGYLYILFPLTIIGILFNICNLIILFDKKFVGPTYLYLKWLAVVDLITLIILSPYCITSYTQPRHFQDAHGRSLYLSHVFIPFANTFATTSILITVTVAIQRLVGIKKPMAVKLYFEKRRVIISLILILAISLTLNTPNFIVYRTKCGRVEVSTLANTQTFRIYAWFFVITIRILPIIILTVTNALLLHAIKEANARAAKIKGSVDRQQRQEQMVTIMLISVVSLFIIGSLPFVFGYPGIAQLFYGESLDKESYKTHTMIANITETLIYSCSFLLYTAFNTDFRATVRIRLLRIPQPPRSAIQSEHHGGRSGVSMRNSEAPPQEAELVQLVKSPHLTV